ncbi:MAG: hypothetical protein V2I35_11480 [Desulfocapsaceae bacterium]|jgi:hypothetical protein|nr:hypothetical protein [Desulfocapsaceae bacterium]
MSCTNKKAGPFSALPVGGACSYFFFVLGIELETPTRPAPSRNIVTGSATEDVTEIMKKAAIIATLKSNLYMVSSGSSGVLLPDSFANALPVRILK